MNEEQRIKLLKAFINVRRLLMMMADQGELTQAEFLVLRRIKIEQQESHWQFGVLKAVRISQGLAMSPPALSRILNSLEGKRLIERQINQDNRRSLVIVLTPLGESALEKVQARVNHALDHLIANLGEEEAFKLLSLMEKTVDILSGEFGEGSE